MKIAIVHDWLVTYAGAEKVLEQMLEVFPDADLFSLVDFIDDDKRTFLKGKRATTSFIQRLPFAKTKYRNYLPLMPLAIEQLDMSDYDVIISSNYAVAKGVLSGPDQLHICYCHSPIRYAWDLQHQYLKEQDLDFGSVKGWIARWFLFQIRLWDHRSASGVDHFISNSKFISRRIEKTYRRDSTVIYPPVDVHGFEFCAEKEDFYLTASRLVPYKKIDLIVEAFNQMPDKRLVVIGDGPDYAKVKAKAGANVSVLGYQDFESLKRYMQRARAFVFAAEEDFGIVPVEAQACGTPVIAFGKGGSLETVVGMASDRPTGVFFDFQTVESIAEAITRFEDNLESFSAQACRESALAFSPERFREVFKAYVITRFEEFKASTGFGGNSGQGWISRAVHSASETHAVSGLGS